MSKRKIRLSFNAKYPKGKRLGICQAQNKVQYPDAAEAHKDAKRLRKSTGLKLQQYQCKYCEAWHNGHDRPPSGRQRNLTPKDKSELYKTTPKAIPEVRSTLSD